MNVRGLIRELERYVQVFGDDEIEFELETGEGEPFEAVFRKTHDGYREGHNGVERVCEIKLLVLNGGVE